MSTAVSSALVVKLDFSPAPASDAAAALATAATATAATMAASLSAAVFLRLLINAAVSAITAAMKFVKANAIAAQPRARRLVEIVRFNAQDAREFSDPLVRDAIASVFIAADLPRRYVGGVGKLAHCHPAMLTVFLQALSDVCVDGLLAIHGDHPPNAKNGRRARRGGVSCRASSLPLRRHPKSLLQ